MSARDFVMAWWHDGKAPCGRRLLWCDLVRYSVVPLLIGCLLVIVVRMILMDGEIKRQQSQLVIQESILILMEREVKDLRSRVPR